VSRATPPCPLTPRVQAKSLCAGVPNLYAVETVDSEKLATLLDNAWAAAGAAAQPPRRLDVFVQVNTSGEESKYGVEPAEAPRLARHVVSSCPHLLFCGLMTIGQPDYTSRPENFQALQDCRQAVCAELGCAEESVELSMGMSGDFEAAIAMGSTNVRVGSTLFGAREYPPK
jgi:PLP dependent protein